MTIYDAPGPIPASWEGLTTPPSPTPQPDEDIPLTAQGAVRKAMQEAKNLDYVEMLVQMIENAGFDPNSQEWALVLDNVAALPDLGEAASSTIGMLFEFTMQQQYGGSSWAQSLVASHFNTYQEPVGQGGKGIDRSPWTPTPMDVHPETGWYRFDEGVMVDPSQGIEGVVYDPSESAPGSPAWMRSVQAQWTPEQTQAWRKKLVKLGYLKDKKGGWDFQLMNALDTYYRVYYVNGKRELPWTGDGSGETKPEPVNLRPFRAQVQNDVQAQFVRVFGSLPSEAELNEWTNFVIQTGMMLQRKHEMAPETAMGEAEMRMTQRIQNSPEGRLMIQAEEENTGLRDSILQGIYAMKGLVG